MSRWPFQPPLPVAWNLPFQPEEGSHTSILMSESGEGLSVAATRQKAGRFVNCAPPPRPPPCGGANAPAATDCAIVIVASGNLSDESISHDCAAAGRAFNSTTVVMPAITARPKGRALPALRKKFIKSLRRAGPFGPAEVRLSLVGQGEYVQCLAGRRRADLRYECRRHESRAAAAKARCDRDVLLAVGGEGDRESLDGGREPCLPQHLA